MKNGKLGTVTLGSGCGGERSEPGHADPGKPTFIGLENIDSPKRHLDSEVVAMAQRRRFSAKYKLKILEQADAAVKENQLGALLRREGLYYSYVSKWQIQKDRGLLNGSSSIKRGRKPVPTDESASREIKRLERENTRLKNELRKAEIIIDVQKKMSELLGIEQPPIESNDNS